VKVKLTGYEMLIAAQAGVMRQVEAIRRERADNHGFAGDGWGVHIEGAGAELAVAKATGLFWEAVVKNPDALPGDVGEVQVRSTTRPDGRLIVHREDPDDTLFIFVTGKLPEYTIRGAIPSTAAKDEKFWADPAKGRPAFFVPHGALSDLSTFDLSPVAMS
jgi:hypothetical protein